MPKVISRGINVGDNRDEPEEQLFTYHCLCGALALIVDVALPDLRARTTDGARYLDTDRHRFKLNVEDGEVVYLRR